MNTYAEPEIRFMQRRQNQRIMQNQNCRIMQNQNRELCSKNRTKNCDPNSMKLNQLSLKFGGYVADLKLNRIHRLISSIHQEIKDQNYAEQKPLSRQNRNRNLEIALHKDDPNSKKIRSIKPQITRLCCGLDLELIAPIKFR